MPEAQTPTVVDARSLQDSYENVVSGLGLVGQDKGASGTFTVRQMLDAELLNAYRGDWIARKIVDKPAFDMVRNWRTFQVDKKDITALANEERRLGLRKKVERAIKLARLYGGSAILLDDGARDLSTPLRVTAKKGLRQLVVIPRSRITPGNVDFDPYSETFDQPVNYQLSGGERGHVDVHPSRVVTFCGNEIPDPDAQVGMSTSEARVFGDSILIAVRDAILSAAATNTAIASLIQEAKVDVVKIQGLMVQSATEDFRKNITSRWALAAILKSIHNVMLLDSTEEFETKTATFTGLPEIAQTMLQIVSGAADMPATVMLSQSPAGMNATGESDLQNYDQMITARQENDLSPRLEVIDEALYVSALGSKPEGAHSRWNPLRIMTEVQKAEIRSKNATTAKTIVDTGLVPQAAMEVAFQNALIEEGAYPGLEEAIEDAKNGALLPFEDPANPENDIDPRTGQPYKPDDPRNPVAKAANENEPREVQVEGGKVSIKARVKKPTRDGIIQDAKPRTLYVSRRLLNAAEVKRWAESQGLTETVEAAQMHVTLAFSRQPVDWMKVPGDYWSAEDDGSIIIRPGGARLVEPLGSEGAIVLLFKSDSLEWRHQSIRGAGASWDFDEYQPHVTLTYKAPEGVDLASIEPFHGPLRFGPEIFEEVIEDWGQKVVHDEA